MLDLADGSDAPKFSTLNINNYTTGGILQVDAVWNNEPTTSNIDKIRILGTIAIQDKPTTVQT